jgi:NitT/TauT family transport system substrate-binding protein
MKRIGLIVAAALVLVAVGAFLYFQQGPASSATPVVRIAYLPTSSCLPLFVALERGYFEEAGIKVETVRFTGTNDALNAVLAGRADGTPGFGLSSFYAIEATNPGALKIYLPCVEDETNYASDILVPVDSRVRSIEELDGKKVGTYVSSTQVLYLKLMMARILPPGHKWEVVQVDQKLELQALASGQFDALFALEPNATKAVRDGIARVLVANPRAKYILSPFPAGANCFSSSFIDSRSGLAAQVAQVFVRAAKDIRDNPNGARQYLPKYTPIDATVATRVGLYTWWLPGEEDFAALQKLADMLQQEQLIRARVSVTSMYYGVPGQRG